MNSKELINETIILLKETKTALLSYTDLENYPSSRWMSPAILTSTEGIIYAVTSPNLPKTKAIQKNPRVEWSFQNKNLTKIINIKGKMNVLDNPSLKSEIMEYMGSRLGVFWKISGDISDYLVLETIAEEGAIFNPMKGTRKFASFRNEVN